MLTITSIKPQKNKKRVNIYLDDRFGFGLDLETFVKSGLKIRQELSEGDIEKIVKEGEFQITYDKILRFATLRPRSEKEFEIWLIKHKVHQSIHKELFNRLKRLELLDDKKFATWWTEQRKMFRPKSKRGMNYELRMKGISQEIITEVLSELQLDEKAIIRNLLSKNDKKWKGLVGFEKRKKIFNYLAGKGFGYEVIKEVVEELLDD